MVSLVKREESGNQQSFDWLRQKVCAVEHVLSGTVLSGHPFLSGHLTNFSKVTSIERLRLFSGRGHPFHGSKFNFSLF